MPDWLVVTLGAAAYIFIGILVAVGVSLSDYIDEGEFVVIAVGWPIGLPLVLLIGLYHSAWTLVNRRRKK